MAANTRCENVVLLDLRGRSPVTEFFVIATGTSPRQMRTVVDEVQDLGKSMGFTAWQTSGYESARWILVDCVNVVCHVFDTDARDFYDLELLWGDCPRIDWRKELGLPPALELRDASAVSTQERFREAAGMDNLDAEQEDARLEGRDLEAEEGDADVDEDAETDAPVVMELPDESTGSNSVEFVEIDPPSKRRKRGRAVYPTPIGDQDRADEEAGMESVPGAGLAAADQSLDEDDQERDAESAADRDPEAVSREDLPRSRMVSRPMGGVSTNMTAGSIAEGDEEDQSGDRDLDDVEQDHRDETHEAYEAASEGITFAKPVGDETGVDMDTEDDAERSVRGKVMKNRTGMRAPRQAAPGPVDVKKAKMAVKTGGRRGRKSAEGSIADAPEPAKGKLPVRKMSKTSAKSGSARGNTGGRAGARKTAARKTSAKSPAKKSAAKKSASKKPAARKSAAKAKKPATKKRR
ncbi:MAG TPA: ribosome silencing factor [Phycisphaerae bacterium]|nr:ribosome silencing factor [Phycisphaerae bacterium]